jgi:hypothetical protein
MESNMTTETGGPAFPAQVKFFDEPTTGMTLRDYFAAKAMQGMLSANGDSNGYLEYEEETVAANAYKLADAMLRARSK